MAISNGFNQLPTVIRSIIASYLPPEALSTSSTASQLFHKLMSDGTFWKLAADRLELKNNVTKENAKGKLLSLYGAINCIALYCLPEDIQKELSSTKDTFSLNQQIEAAVKADPIAKEKFQKVNERILHFLHKFKMPKEEVEKLNADPFLLNRKICTYVRGAQDYPLDEFWVLDFTVPDTLPIVRLFCKIGFFENLPPESLRKGIYNIIVNNNMDREDLGLLKDFVNALLRNKTITDEQKNEIFKAVLAKPFYFDPKPLQWEACEFIVSSSGVPPPLELINPLIKYSFQAKKSIFDRKDKNPEKTFEDLEHILKFFLGKCELSKDVVMDIVKQENGKPEFHTNAAFDKECVERLTKLIDEIYKDKA